MRWGVLIGVIVGVAWAGPRVTMEQARIETASGLARGTSVQMEAGEIAAWAENLPPDPPSRLGPEAFVMGDATSTAMVGLTFALADPDPGDRVRAVVEVSTRADFGVVMASGVTTGRPEGRPLRGIASIGSLAEGWYWWRVKAVDVGGAASSWSVANGGEAAFAVDDDPPGAGLEGPPSGSVVRVGEAVEIKGQISGADVEGWEVTITTGGGKPRPYAAGTDRLIRASWTPTGLGGPGVIALTARDAEGFTATVRVEVVVSTTGRPGGRPYAAMELAEEAYGFRSAGVGPNPARAGALVSCHLAVGRADRVRALFYTSAGEPVTNHDATAPVWHGSDLCYEPSLDTRGLASGVYLLVMDAEKEGQVPVRAVRKLLIIK